MKVVGIGSQDDLDYAERFVSATGVTFTMLWSDSFDVWRHYGVSRNSDVWLLDAAGNRVGDSSRPYDQGRIEGLLDDLA